MNSTEPPTGITDHARIEPQAVQVDGGVGQLRLAGRGPFEHDDDVEARVGHARPDRQDAVLDAPVRVVIGRRAARVEA